MEAWSPEKFEENKILENDEYEEDDYYESDESESEHSFISFDSNDKDSLTASKFGQVIPKSTKWNKKLNEVIHELKKNRVSELKTSIPELGSEIGSEKPEYYLREAEEGSGSGSGSGKITSELLVMIDDKRGITGVRR